MGKVAQLVQPVQPAALSAVGAPMPAPAALQPTVAPVSPSSSKVAKGPVSTSGASLTSSVDSVKSSGLKRASILSVLYKYGACVQNKTKMAVKPQQAPVNAKKAELLKAAALAVVTYRQNVKAAVVAAAGPAAAAAGSTFFQQRGTDTLRLARYLGKRFNIDTLRNLSARNLTAAGPGRVGRERSLLGTIGAGATGVAGLGAAGLGYGAYKALGGGKEE